MNLQEREQLTHFLRQMTQAQAGQKDAEAEALIRDAAARQPDAAYLLVQRAIQAIRRDFALSVAGIMAAEYDGLLTSDTSRADSA